MVGIYWKLCGCHAAYYIETRKFFKIFRCEEHKEGKKEESKKKEDGDKGNEVGQQEMF